MFVFHRPIAKLNALIELSPVRHSPIQSVAFGVESASVCFNVADLIACHRLIAVSSALHCAAWLLLPVRAAFVPSETTSARAGSELRAHV